MPFPTVYDPAFSFSGFQASNPTTPLPATEVDAELAAIAAWAAVIQADLELIQRSDGVLMNGSVGIDQLAADALSLFAGSWNPRGAWAGATKYAAKDLVTFNSGTYVCVTAHTSTAFATDLGLGYWVLVAVQLPLPTAGTALSIPRINAGGSAWEACTPVKALLDTNVSAVVTSAIAPTAAALGVGTLAGVLWHDTSTNKLWIRDQADTTWISIGFLDEANKLFKAPGALLNIQNFSVAGSSVYASTAGTSFVIVELLGGGAAGGGAAITTSGQCSGGGGGGAGAYARKRITANFSGVTITIGAAGAASAGAVGGNGGTSSFGALVSAPGGNGGSSAAPSASTQNPAGGVASAAATGGDLNTAGAGGSPGYFTPSVQGISGAGANAVFGGAGQATVPSGGGQPAKAPGAGGGGALNAGAAGAAVAGGAGAAGWCRVWEFA